MEAAEKAKAELRRKRLLKGYSDKKAATEKAATDKAAEKAAAEKGSN